MTSGEECIQNVPHTLDNSKNVTRYTVDELGDKK